MKSVITLIIAVVTALTMSAAQYKVTVVVGNGNIDGTQATLTAFDTGDTLAVAQVNAGRALLTGTIDKAVMARVTTKAGRDEVVLEEGTITLDLSTERKSGTPLNDKFDKINAELSAYSAQAQAIQAEFSQGKMTVEEAQSRMEAFEAGFLAKFKDVADANKDNAIGPWAFTYYLTFLEPDLETLGKLLNEAPAEYASLKRVQGIKTSLEAVAATAEGHKFVDFTMRDPAGKQSKLSDYVKPGQYTLVDFWASWCGPCRREIKNTLKPLYEKYNGKGLQVVGVAVWDEPDDTETAIAQLQLPWPVMRSYYRSSEETDIYGIRGIPHIMIIDGEGTIVSRGLQGEELVQLVDGLMAK